MGQAVSLGGDWGREREEQGLQQGWSKMGKDINICKCVASAV